MNTLIEKGKIRARKGFLSQNDSDRESVNYKMCFLGIEDFQDILDLQDLIAKNLPIAEIFRLHEEDYFRDFFCLERAAVGVITRQGLVAYSIIRIPGNGGDNLAKDIGLPQGELGKVAHLQATVVHPFFRGNGLQQKMAEAHLRVIEDLGFLHVCCTVSPKNPVSLKNILASGFVIKGLRPMFQGWWRYIMYKNILYNMNLDKSEVSEEVNIMDSDIEGQVDLLKKGFVGFKMNRQPEGYRIYYAKP
jgi:ribosomal protein S18 acetylase RimI-like enzyme